MSKIDTKNWLNFPISDFFSVVKGTRLTKANMREGVIRFIGASSVNNGITAYISNKEHLHPGNTITITYNGSVGEAFYQDEIFWASDDVNVLYPKFKLNRSLAMFFIPLLKKAGQKYAFIDKWKREDMEKDCIKLPVDENHQPDFSYMESYMKNLETAVSASLTKLQSAKRYKKSQKVDTSKDFKNWKEFRLDYMFDMRNTKSIVQKNVNPDSGTVPYVTAQNGHNGVLTYIDCPQEWMDSGNCIMIGGKTMTFSYQKEPFCSNDSHNIALYLKEKGQITENSYLFLMTALRAALQSRYSWGDSISMKRIKDEVFFLPVTVDDKPDFAYMDSYMQNIMKESEKKLENLANI